jgi:glutaminase
MKITSFNPLIISNDTKSILEVMEELGFERRHLSADVDNRDDLSSVRMKDSNGFYVDVTQNEQVTQTITAIRMNVDDFDEAYEYLQSKGFVNTKGDKIAKTGSAKAAMMASPSGFMISVVEHIK